MRKLYPFVMGGGLLFYYLDEVHVINTSIKFGDLTGDFATDAVIGWSLGIGLIIMCVKLLLMVLGGHDEERKTYYYDEEYEEEYQEEEEVYQQEFKKTWWNDWYD